MILLVGIAGDRRADRARPLSLGRPLHLHRQRLCRRTEGADHAGHLRQDHPRRRASRASTSSRAMNCSSSTTSPSASRSRRRKPSSRRRAAISTSEDQSHIADQLVDLAQKNVELKQRDVDRKTTLVEHAGGFAGRRRHFDVGAGDRAAAGAIHRPAAATDAQRVARQSRPAARAIPALCAGQGRARAGRARSRPHHPARADRRHRHPGRQHPARPLRHRRHPDPERHRRRAPWVDANPKETDITYLRVGQKVDDRRRQRSRTTPSTAP